MRWLTVAKDDYDVVVYRVLLYLYACMKRKIIFDDNTFHASVRKNVESDEYFCSVLRMMQTEGLICGVVTTKAWGGTYILCSNLCDMEITAAGIHYLKENGRMQKIWSILKDAADITAELATKVGLFI